MASKLDSSLLLALLLLTLYLCGCSAHRGASIWVPSPIKGPEDARRIAEDSIQEVPLPPVDVPDPRQWNHQDPENAWHLTLAEAIASAVGNSAIVRTVPAQQSLLTNALQVDRTTTFEPAIADTGIEAQLGRFDAVLEGLLLARPEENPPNSSPNGSSRRPQVLDRFTQGAALRKPMITGGEASLIFDTEYRNVPPRFSREPIYPQYQPEFGVDVIQPLLRGAGKVTNLNPVIIVAAKAQQSNWELHDELIAMTRSIESVYWTLYEARNLVRTIDRAIPLLDEAVRLAEAQMRADLAIPADVAQAEAELYEFRQRRIAALTTVRQQEDLLRDLMGLPPESNSLIIPDEPPAPESPEIDWQATIDAALENRPDIIRQRLAVYVAERATELAENQTLPQVDGIAAWRAKGLGQDLGEALDLLADAHYNDWVAGISLEYPWGNHTAKAQLRAARLTTINESAKLQESIHAAIHQLSQIVYEVDALYREYQAARLRHAANRRWMRGARARYVNPIEDGTLARSLDLYLKAIRATAESEQNVVGLAVRYQIALAKLQEAQGQLLSNRRLYLENDPRARVDQVIELERLPPVAPVEDESSPN